MAACRCTVIAADGASGGVAPGETSTGPDARSGRTARCRPRATVGQRPPEPWTSSRGERLGPPVVGCEVAPPGHRRGPAASVLATLLKVQPDAGSRLAHHASGSASSHSRTRVTLTVPLSPCESSISPTSPFACVVASPSRYVEWSIPPKLPSNRNPNARRTCSGHRSPLATTSHDTSLRLATTVHFVTAEALTDALKHPRQAPWLRGHRCRLFSAQVSTYCESHGDRARTFR